MGRLACMQTYLNLVIVSEVKMSQLFELTLSFDLLFLRLSGNKMIKEKFCVSLTICVTTPSQ